MTNLKPALSLSKNDRRVLEATRSAQADFGGFIPHGSADWIGVRRLWRSGALERIGWAVCMGCDNPRHRCEPTELPAFIVTAQGGDL